VGTLLDGGAPLSSNFYLWFEINILNGTVSYPVDWPPGTNLFFDSMNQAILVAGANAWGNVYPVDTGNCPIGVSIDPMHIGATPITAGVPSTTVHYGPGQPPNDLVALLIPGSMAIPNNSVKARYRIANWPSVVGTGGDWHDLAPSAGGGVPGTINNIGSQTTFHCVNPPDTSDTACYQLPSGAPTNQCLLVELSQANGSGVQFVHDSAYVCLDYTDGSKDAGAPDASGSDGASDALGTDANTPGDVSADLPRDAFDERDVGPAPDVTAGDDGAGRSDVGVADTDGDVSKADGNGTDAPNDVALDSNSRLDSSNDVGADGTAGAGGAPGDSSAEGGPSGQDGSGGATAPDAKNDSDAALGPVVDRDGSACICAMPGYDRANGRGRSFALWGLVILASSRARAMRRRREREFLANQRLS
jgi:hypothetical protein